MQNSLANKQQQRPTFAQFVADPRIKANTLQVLGTETATQKFLSSVVAATTKNNALMECNYGSIVSSALQGEALKLSPSPQMGHYYMLPFNDKNGEKKAEFVLGYKGYIQLAIRSGEYRHIIVSDVKAGELKSWNLFTEEIELDPIVDDLVREQTPTVGYVATLELMNGFKKTIYWTKEKMEVHADKYSPAFSLKGTILKSGKKKVSFKEFEEGKFDKKDSWMYSSFWYQDFDGMACKTMIRQLISKWGIMSVDMIRAFESDNTIESDDGDRVVTYDTEFTESVSEPIQEQPEQTPVEPQEVPESEPMSLL